MATTTIAVGTMKLAAVPKPGADFQIVEREIPEPGPGSVRIKVQACASATVTRSRGTGLSLGIKSNNEGLLKLAVEIRKIIPGLETKIYEPKFR